MEQWLEKEVQEVFLKLIIKVDNVIDSNISVYYLDCFRFQVCGSEYNVLLNKSNIDLYQYEIWKKDGNKLTFVNNVFISLDKFREYYFADERSTNYKIITELIIPTIIK
ncbi:hypothetical protein [uncultured Faecalicoccus sp.]|uniref:hypothetical protein n=1 Tax=uncultured Faecalicoccus sp. TaxID=1971760 RepID=UPI00258D0A18|nr:hypothetical protein [uncultured Faecalicoccus sp.]